MCSIESLNSWRSACQSTRLAPVRTHLKVKERQAQSQRACANERMVAPMCRSAKARARFSPNPLHRPRHQRTELVRVNDEIDDYSHRDKDQYPVAHVRLRTICRPCET